MANVSENPELTQEVIRLLHKELSALRTQLAEAEQRRGSTQHGPPPSYADAHIIDALRKENGELLRERDSLRLELVGERRKACSNPEHFRATAKVDQLTRQLADAMQERDSTEKQRKNILEVEAKYAIMQEKYRALSGEASVCPQPSYTPGLFDIDFFLHLMHTNPIVQVPSQYKGPFSNILHLRLHKKASDLMKHGSMRYSHSEVIWKAPGQSYFLAVGPMHMFNPKAGGGEGCWERAVHQQNLAENPKQQRDILFLHDHTWHYYGTFECVGTIAVHVQKAKQIASDQVVTYAEKRTILDSESAPPNMSKLVHNMYATGVLRMECFGYKWVGFDEALSAALMQTGSWTRERKTQDTNVASGSTEGAQKQEQKGQRRAQGKGRGTGEKKKTNDQKRGDGQKTGESKDR